MEIQQQQFTNIITALTGLRNKKRCTIFKQIPQYQPTSPSQSQQQNVSSHHTAIMLWLKLSTQAIMFWEKLCSPIMPQLLRLNRICYIKILQLEFGVLTTTLCCQIIQRSMMTIQRELRHFQYVLLTFGFRVKMTFIPHLKVVALKILQMNLKWKNLLASYHRRMQWSSWIWSRNTLPHIRSD